jgi:hypothetical protein
MIRRISTSWQTQVFFFLIRALGADVEIVMLDLELGKPSLSIGKSAAHRAAVMKSGQRGTLPKSVT